MNKKARLKVAIDALILLSDNDEVISEAVTILQAHVETLPDENTMEGDDSGGSNPPPGKERGGS